MIPRSLVPRDVRPLSDTPAAPPRRLTTLLDDRTVVAANLPRMELDPRTTIPAHLPLDVLASRVVVPRDMPVTPFDPKSLNPDYAPLTALDERVTVPVALPVVELHPRGGPVSVQDLPDVLEPDVINTGEVNLMVEPIEAPPINWNWVARTGSIAAHILLIAFLLFQTRLFPYHPPSAQQIDLARQQLNFIYMPPDVRGLTAAPPAPPAPRVRIDPRVLRQMAPPVETSSVPSIPAPKAPERAVRETPTEPPPDLPPAPKPQLQAQNDNSPPDFLRGPAAARVQPAPQPQQQQPTSNGLILPRMSSPGRELEQSAQEAARGGGATSEQFGGPVAGGGSYGGGGGSEGYMGGAVQMLTPTQGVDFTNYLARVVASVKRNWYSVMPESARLGEQGRVILQFRIMQSGSVPDAEPQLVATSSKEPLDRAAISSIRASSPFEPLPSAFSGPFIELRFIFLYNLPYSAAQ